MNRSQLVGHLLAAVAVISTVLLCQSRTAAGDKTSASKVKATATASKIGPDGKQTVDVTLEIEKGWHLYANSVQHETLEPARTKIAIKAGVKLKVDVKYPPGHLHVDGTDKFYIYQEKVEIQVRIQRTTGDTSPFQIIVYVNACKDGKEGVCLLPGEIPLTVP